MVRVLWHWRSSIARNALSELRLRYAGSTAGIIWNVLAPLAQIAVFGVVFAEVMRIREPSLGASPHAFTIYLCAGILPWQAFAETITRGANSFLVNAAYLKRLPVPEQVFVAQDALAGFYGLCISMALFAVAALVLGHPPSLAWIQVPAILIGMQGLAFGIGLALGVLQVYFRDVGPILPLALMVWFWLTPIVYFPDILPPAFRAAAGLNPAFVYVDALHRTLVSGEWVGPVPILAGLAVAASACAISYLVLRALRSELRDLL